MLKHRDFLWISCKKYNYSIVMIWIKAYLTSTCNRILEVLNPDMAEGSI
jgi:hypothetical protein